MECSVVYNSPIVPIQSKIQQPRFNSALHKFVLPLLQKLRYTTMKYLTPISILVCLLVGSLAEPSQKIEKKFTQLANHMKTLDKEVGQRFKILDTRDEGVMGEIRMLKCILVGWRSWLDSQGLMIPTLPWDLEGSDDGSGFLSADGSNCLPTSGPDA